VVIKQNQPYALIPVKSNKVGSTTFDIRGSDIESQFTFTSHTTDPTSFGLAYAKSTLPDTTTLLAVQILDSAGNPVYAQNDIELTLVSNDESVIEVPNKLVIPKGEYRTIFEINTLNEGNSEIAILSEDLPLAKYDMNVKGIQPDMRLSVTPSPAMIDEEIQGTLSVSYPGINLSPEGLDVEWVVTDADIITKDSVTNENGQALINVISQKPGKTTIKAIINGIGIQNAEALGNADVVIPEGSTVALEPENSGLLGLDLYGFNIIFLIVPVAAAAAILFLKRTNRLEEISERLNMGDFSLGERFEEIKERVAGIRER
ncbi:MAG: Ig-like domain-containing protein, partial [Nitrosopumilaceae archaeon]